MTPRLRKLATMSLGEIAWRLRRAALERYGEASQRRRAAPATPRFGGAQPVPAPAPALVPAGREAERLLDWLRTRPGYVQRAVEEAEATRRHRFVLLGRQVQYGPDVPWCADPLSGRPWPMVYHARVPIFDGDTGTGDCKFVWELNRHQFLPTLAKAFRLTGDRAYAEAAIELLRSWIAQNPCGVGINWASGLEVAVRSLSWAWTYALLHGTDAFDVDARRTVLGALEQHARHIERHLSYYFSPYNHLVGELTALFVLGTVFPFLGSGPVWARKGWDELGRLFPAQFHDDGGSVEQSTAYHHFTVGFYVQAYLVRRATGQPVPAAFLDRLTRAFEFSMHLMRPDGTLPMVGDADEARAVDVGQASLWDFRAHLSVGAALFGRADMKFLAGPLPAEAAWLVGLDAATRYEALPASPPALASHLLPGSGYAVMRAGWGAGAHHLVFDAGQLAAGVSERDTPSAAHGHADALSVDLAVHGEPVLVDPGFYTYNGDPAWHRYFRETAAHNTVVVDGRSQAEFRGRLTWSCGPRVTVHRWAAGKTADLIDASHSGYRRLTLPVTHRRIILFVKPDYWLVRDEFAGEGAHQIDRYFHFAPGVVTEAETPARVRASTRAGGGLVLVAIESEEIDAEIREGGSGPDGGWVAVGYEKRVPGAVVRWRTRLELPSVRHTVLLPRRPTPGGAAPVVRCAGRAGTVTIELDGGRRDTLLLAPPTAASLDGGEWHTDARMAVVRLDPSGAVERCLLVDGSVLARREAPVLTLDRRVGLAALVWEDRGAILELSGPAAVRDPSAAQVAPASEGAGDER